MNRTSTTYLVIATAIVCVMAASLAQYASKSDNGNASANKAAEQPQSSGLNDISRIHLASPASPPSITAKGLLPDENETDPRNRSTTSTSSDEAMLPDEFEPNPLLALGLDLRNNPADLAKMMELLKTETDPEKLRILAQLIAENAEAAGMELPVKDLLELTASDMKERRQAALLLLSTLSDVTPEMITAVSQMGRGDAEKDVRLMAIRTVAEWMNGESTLKEQLSHELIAMRDSSDDPTIRGYAIQSVANQKNGMPDSMMAPMVESLRIEAQPGNRSLAALALSDASPAIRPQVTQNLEQAFSQESDLTVKRHLLTMIMKTGGADATTILKRLPASDPQLRQDVNDYVEIISSGVTDVNKIYEIKNARDGDRGTEIYMK